MKSDQLFNDLKLLVGKLGIEISEQNFRNTGIAVKSGLCKVKGKDLFLIDKHLKLVKKVEILAEFLGSMPLETIEVAPDVRAYLDRFRSIPVREGARLVIGEIDPDSQSE